MPAPPGRIVAASELANGGVAKDRFDPPSHAGRRLGLVPPDRLYAPDHVVHVNVGNRHAADLWVDVRLQRRIPLLAVLGVLPTVAVCLQVRLGAVLERDDLRLLGDPRLLRLPLLRQRIEAVCQQQP
jgi:hypothetical protein